MPLIRRSVRLRSPTTPQVLGRRRLPRGLDMHVGPGIVRHRRRAAALCTMVLCVGVSSVGISGTADAATPGPALLQADAVNAGDVELAWTSTPGASQYTVYRDGAPILTANTLRTSDTAITGGSTHSYWVTADVAGVDSDPSPVSTVAVPLMLDTKAPSTPLNLKVTSLASTTASLSWGASSDDIGVIGYFVKRGGVLYSYTEGSNTTTIRYLKANTHLHVRRNGTGCLRQAERPRDVDPHNIAAEHE